MVLHNVGKQLGFWEGIIVNEHHSIRRRYLSQEFVESIYHVVL